jgi:hypothetical protein
MVNKQLEKLLKDLEQSRFFGTVEIGFQNGVPGHASVKRNYKFAADGPASTNRENRGESNGRQETENR